MKRPQIILALLGLSIIACAVFGYMVAISPNLVHYPGRAWQGAAGVVWFVWGAPLSAFAFARAKRLWEIGLLNRKLLIHIGVAGLLGVLACSMSLLVLLGDVLTGVHKGDWAVVGQVSMSLCTFGIAGFLLLAEAENGRLAWGWLWVAAQLVGIAAVIAIVWGVPDLLGIPISQTYRAAALPLLVPLPLIVPFVAFNVHRFWTPSGRWAGSGTSGQVVTQPPATLAH